MQDEASRSALRSFVELSSQCLGAPDTAACRRCCAGPCHWRHRDRCAGASLACAHRSTVRTRLKGRIQPWYMAHRQVCPHLLRNCSAHGMMGSLQSHGAGQADRRGRRAANGRLGAWNRDAHGRRRGTEHRHWPGAAPQVHLVSSIIQSFNDLVCMFACDDSASDMGAWQHTDVSVPGTLWRACGWQLEYRCIFWEHAAHL